MSSQTSGPDGGPPPFHRGLAELHRYLFHFEEAALPRAVDAFRAAAESAPGNAGHWAALGFALDASDLPARAMSALQRAHDIDPEDEEVDVFIVTLQCELGPEPEAMLAVEALARRHAVDLEPVRRELAAADMPDDSRTVLMHAFQGLGPDERAEALSITARHATSIHVWLDTFEDDPMTPEAAAFMYLLLGLEEGITSSGKSAPKGDDS